MNQDMPPSKNTGITTKILMSLKETDKITQTQLFHHKYTYYMEVLLTMTR